jgi:signal transduction histidine kinase/CheY-like chemotaxis protein
MLIPGQKQGLKGRRRGCPGLLLASLLLCACRSPAEEGAAGDLYINLQDYPLYLKRGFERELAERPPDPGDGSWRRYDPRPGIPSAVKIKNSGLPGLPERRFLSPGRGRDEEFTMKIPFVVEGESLDLLRDEAAITPGIFLAGLGDNWEIFLNGVTVKSEIHLDGEGQILSHRAYHHVYFPVRRSLFAPGDNVLTIRLVGDPTYENTGFFVNSPFYVGNMDTMRARHDESLAMILFGVYIIVGIYHLVLFIIRRDARYNLYYGLFSSSLGIYFLLRSSAVFMLIRDTNILHRVDTGILFMVIPLMASFAEELNFKKIRPWTRICLGVFAFLALLQACFSMQFGEEILRIWQALAIGAALYTAVFDFFYVFFTALRKNRKQAGGTVSLPGILGRMIVREPLGNLLIGLCILLATGLFDLVDAMILHYNLFTSRYGFFVFTVGAAFVLAREFGSLYKALNRANAALEKSNAGLEATVQERTRELEVQTSLAERASRAKTEFLARMSHEIRTPLNAIIGLADAELRTNRTGEIGEDLREIRNSGAVLLAIINDLLDISKIESGRLELSPGEYRPADLLRESARMNLFRVGSKPLRLEADIAPSLPSRLYGDEIRIKQVLNNLLSNACKYTDKGSVKLRVWGEGEGPEMVLWFSVEDTGRGIREEDLKDLFSEYRRFDEEADRNIEGTGLGLSITKKLVELMDGGITARSVYQKGSVFTVWIPQKIADPAPVGTVNIFESSGAYGVRGEERKIDYFQKPGVTVLVVDDMITNLKVTQALLKPYGFKVSCVTGGRQAVDLFREGRIKFDLVFMDHMMPAPDGLETVRIIRNEIEGDHAKTTPIIALTANAIVGNEAMFLENGFQGFLSKPIDLGELDRVLRTWLL